MPIPGRFPVDGEPSVTKEEEEKKKKKKKMTMLEKLFVQIFERKKRIIDQVRDQILLFDHHLASKCLIEGFDPPAWLLSSSKSELSKEDLISGLLLPQQQSAIPCPTTQCSLYQQPVVTAENLQFPDCLQTGVGVLNEDFDTEVLSQCPSDKVGCAPNDKSELEPSVTSPKHCLGATISAINADPPLSLARIQRSKSRQRALELRNSAKAAKSSSISKKNDVACNSQVTGSKVTYLQFGMDEVVLEKAVDRDIRNCAVHKENIDPCQSNERCENVYSGRITRSRSSSQPPKSVNGPSSAGNPYIAKNDGNIPSGSLAKSKQQADVDGLLRVVKPSATSDDNCGMRDAKAGNNESNEKASNADLRRLIRSKSSSQHHECVKECQNLGRCYDKNAEDDILKSKQQPDHINEIMKKVKSFGNADESRRIKAKMGDCQRQENIVDKSNGINAISGNHCARSFNLTAVDNEVTEWRPLAPNKSSLAKSLNRSQEVTHQIVSCTKVNPLPCAVGIDIIDPDKCDAIVADTDVDSGELAEAHSAKSSSNSGSANKPSLDKSSNGFEGGRLEITVSSPQSASPMTVKPKQLYFDDMEECRLTHASRLPLMEEEEAKLSERKSFIPLCSADRPVEITSFDDRQNSNFPLEVQLPVEGEVLIKEGNLKYISEADKEETCRSGRTSNSKVVSSMKESSGVYIDRDAGAWQESNKISQQNFSLIYHSPTNQVAYENFLGNLLKDAVGSKLSKLDANREIDSPHERVSEPLEVEKPTELVPVIGDFHTHIFGDPEISVDANFARVNGPTLLKNADETPTGSAMGHPCTISTYETKGDFEQQQIKSGTCHIQHADSYSMGRREGDERDKSVVPIQSNSAGNQISKKSMQPGRSSSSHMEGSSFHKRRKIESQLTSPPSASSSLKDQGMESNDKDQNAVCGSISSSKLQVDKVKFSVEAKETKAETHLGFIDEGLLSVLCLSKEAPANSQACAVEETGVADRASITSGSGRQLEIEENQIFLEAEDKLEQGDTEHLICDEGSLLESLSHLRETGVFPNYSIDFQHRQPIALLSADQSKPEFEGFIMQTDNEQTLNAGEGISIDKLELPETSIEDASLLEQFCRSACFQTPFSPFPTTCKIQKSPSVHHSVPNGLLECLGMGNILPINSDASQLPKVSTSSFGEEVSHALHGKSFPISRSQQTWDSKQPYTSPVGKLWDRITSYSGSSEKRGSIIPELPCITEENENIDEVADAYEEGNGSDAVTCSVKRKPLAEIKEDPNVPSLISEAELFCSRNSLESVSNDYSVNCTKNSVKQKAAIRKTSKRRDTNRSNENQSMPGGENGTKRASESVCNRFNNSKLSGKESLRKGGPSFLERESNINNIVTNTSSFVTLLQQKQAAAVVKGKRDVKVKALEAAEAAKRLAEKKENERKMKKEALKLERARLEQENLRQLDLQRKKKEEERKKKEAEMAARKRQREEEERLEKDRKRKRIEETRKQQRGAEEKLRVKKDEKEKFQEQDARVNEMKIPNGQPVKNEKMEKETRDECIGKKSETKYRTTEASTNDSGKISSVLEDYNSKVIREVEKAKGNNNLIANTIQEESYDISPYKGSDDEDEEDEPNKKFIPSWASKNYLASSVASQKKLDAEVVFPPDSFCSIDEVLLPRKHQLRRGPVK